MSWTDPDLIHIAATGAVAPAAWGVVVNDDLNFLNDPPGCSVYSSSVQTLTTNVLTALAANQENSDTDGMHSTVSQNTRITGQTDGRYMFLSNVTFPANATGGRLLDFAVNGVTLTGSGMQLPSPGNTAPINLTYVRVITLVAGDYVEARARQVSGGNMDVTLIEFACTYLGR